MMILILMHELSVLPKKINILNAKLSVFIVQNTWLPNGLIPVQLKQI